MVCVMLKYVKNELFLIFFFLVAFLSTTAKWYVEVWMDWDSLSEYIKWMKGLIQLCDPGVSDLMSPVNEANSWARVKKRHIAS